MESKNFIEKRTRKKKSKSLVDTIRNAKKKEGWNEVAKILSGPRSVRVDVNIDELSNNSKEGEKIIVPGKVLSQGSLTKKFKVVALSYSKSAEEKLLNAGCEVLFISDEIKNNPDAKGIRVLKK